MLMEEQMIISGVSRIWCEGNTKRGIDCEDRDHCRTYERPIRPWLLNFRLRLQTQGLLSPPPWVVDAFPSASFLDYSAARSGGIVSPLSQIGCRLHPIPPCGRPYLDPYWGFVPGPIGDFCTPNLLILPKLSSRLIFMFFSALATIKRINF